MIFDACGFLEANAASTSIEVIVTRRDRGVGLDQELPQEGRK